MIVLTHNEAINIRDCLLSVAWADQVIVVDSGSQDETLAIARQTLPQVHIAERPFDDFGGQRNFALSLPEIRHEWVLFLDADERCTPALRAELEGAMVKQNEVVGYYLTCRNFFLGKWIRRCTLYPSWQLRFLKRGKVHYRKEGHGQREVTDGKLDYLHQPYDHYGFSQGIAHWVARHNAYSTNEVELIHRLRSEPLGLGQLFGSQIERRRTLKRMASRLEGLRPWARFLYLYLWRMGFLDGRAGWVFCLLRLSHEIHIFAKLRELKATPGTPDGKTS